MMMKCQYFDYALLCGHQIIFVLSLVKIKKDRCKSKLDLSLLWSVNSRDINMHYSRFFYSFLHNLKIFGDILRFIFSHEIWVK